MIEAPRLPAAALRDLARRLGVVMQTMATDDMSDPQTPLRARLVERIMTLADVITTLRAAADDGHRMAAAAAAMETPEAATASLSLSSQAGTPAPPTFHVAPDGPGRAEDPTPAAPPSAAGARIASRAPEPPQAQAAAARSAPPRRGGRRPSVWTAERDALMVERFPTSEDDEALLRDLNAIPAPQPVPSARQVQRRAWELGIKRAEHLRFAAHKRAGSAAMAARRARGDFAPSKWTAERETLLRAELPDCVDTRALLARINALPGEPIASVDSMRQRAKTLGIRRSVEAARFAQGAARRGKPDAPAEVAATDAPAAHIVRPSPSPRPHALTAAAWAGSPRKGALLPARPDDEKAEAFECFDAGMSVRDVAADLGTPLSTLITWHAEWKLRGRKDAAA